MKTSLRFEILKRDKFTCCYCGKTGGETLLEVDHVIPKAAGGSDDSVNLVTACVACNRGKAARLLIEGRLPMVSEESLAALRARIARAHEYESLREAEEETAGRMMGDFWAAWAQAFGGSRTEEGWEVPGWSPRFPREATVKGWVRRYGPAEVMACLDLAAERFFGHFSTKLPKADVERYMVGILNRREAQRSGA